MNDFKEKLSKIDPNESFQLANKLRDFHYYCKRAKFIISLKDE